MIEPLMTPEDAIAYLRLDRDGPRKPYESLRWLYRTGKLKYTKVGRYVRFRQAWLDELIDQHAVCVNRLAATLSAKPK